MHRRSMRNILLDMTDIIKATSVSLKFSHVPISRGYHGPHADRASVAKLLQKPLVYASRVENVMTTQSPQLHIIMNIVKTNWTRVVGVKGPLDSSLVQFFFQQARSQKPIFIDD